MRGAGRFAPSPTGDLHLGNLRTALAAYLCAKSTGRAFLLRFEDLDIERVAAAPGARAGQEADLGAIGIAFDGDPVQQSDRLELYAAALVRLRAEDMVYECFCTRKEIAAAVSAPHAAPGAYPGTCRELTAAQRAQRRRTRRPALRLRSHVTSYTVHDALAGATEGVVDDFVLVRGDGAYAYNLAVVVDDLTQNIDQVVRGDDLLSSAPRQAYLASVLGGRAPDYVHVPLVVNRHGERLSKRDGAVALADRLAAGDSSADVVEWLLRSLGVEGCATPAAAVARFTVAEIPRAPVVFED